MTNMRRGPSCLLRCCKKPLAPSSHLFPFLKQLARDLIRWLAPKWPAKNSPHTVQLAPWGRHCMLTYRAADEMQALRREPWAREEGRRQRPVRARAKTVHPPETHSGSWSLACPGVVFIVSWLLTVTALEKPGPGDQTRNQLLLHKVHPRSYFFSKNGVYIQVLTQLPPQEQIRGKLPNTASF